MGMGGLFDAVTQDEWPGWAETIPASADRETVKRAAMDVAAWLARHLPPRVLVELPMALAVAMSPDVDVAPRLEELLAIINWWNDLALDGMVPHSVRTTKLSKEIVAAWLRWCRDGNLQELWRDRDEIGRRIAAAEMCRSGWFRLEKLLGGSTNADKTLILQKLLDGGYDDNPTTPANATTAAGWGAIQQFGRGSANRRPD